MIKVENISKVFNPKSRNKNQVLKNVSFELPEKGLVAIFGKSGSGKTTLLNIIGGLDKQDSGNIYFNNVPLNKNSDSLRNARIGYIFQNYYLESNYSIAQIIENQMTLAGFKNNKCIKERVDEVLKLVDLERYKNRTADTLSGGQKQRVAIARAIAKGADVILADEPTGNLDASNTIKVMEILKEISKYKLIVLVTHEVSLIKKYADNHIEIVDGEINRDHIIKDTINFETQTNNITVKDNEVKEIKSDGLDIKIFGEPIESDSSLQIVNNKGTLYVKASKNIIVLNEFSEKQIITETVKDENSSCDKLVISDYEKSGSKKNGKFFNFGNIVKLLKLDKSDKTYSSSNKFKHIFIGILSVVICMFSFMLFQSKTAYAENKNIDQSSVYVDLKDYSVIRKLDSSLYGSIDFFNMQLDEGNFSYNEIEAINAVTVPYYPQAIESGTAFDESKITGKLPEDGQVLISRNIADQLKKKLRLNELSSDNAIKMLCFEGEYIISGILETDSPIIYFTKDNYVNFLKVFEYSGFSDFNNLFFNKENTAVSYKTEIKKTNNGEVLNNDEVIIEINRNSIYKMVGDVAQIDYLVTVVNNALNERPKSIQVTNSKLFVKKIVITRETMDSDVNIYINQAVLDNIFVYMSPNLNALSSKNSGGMQTEYYFEINTNGGEQLAALNKELKEKEVDTINIQAQYDKLSNESADDSFVKLISFIAIIILMMLIYFFIEKASSVKNSKEYGIFRAIGVNKSNLIYKEVISTMLKNLAGYLAVYILTATLLSVYCIISNIDFGLFILIASGLGVLSTVLLLGISIVPYLFVIFQTPAQILAKYDV